MVPLTVSPAPALAVDPPPAITLAVITYGPPPWASAGCRIANANNSIAAPTVKRLKGAVDIKSANARQATTHLLCVTEQLLRLLIGFAPRSKGGCRSPPTIGLLVSSPACGLLSAQLLGGTAVHSMAESAPATPA